ncbi:MAG: ABC transporter permease [Erysipelotrichaceae bacterium]|jgi:oligopeptide transport system permease protein
MTSKDYMNIPKEKFKLANRTDSHDKKFDTKVVGYFEDAWIRFKKNKSSVVAAIIILILVIYAIIGPYFCDQNYIKSYATDNIIMRYQYLTPKLSFMEGTGFWDGTKVIEVSQNRYYRLLAQQEETGNKVIVEVVDKFIREDIFRGPQTIYKVRIDNYAALSAFNLTLTYDQYVKLQDWQTETGIQVILPVTNVNVIGGDHNIWYQCDEKGNPVFDSNGDFINAYSTTGVDDYNSLRFPDDPYNKGNTTEAYRYAQRTGVSGNYNYVVRVNAYKYFIYRYGFEPSFAFGTDTNGYDIFTRLASGARFSFVLAILVSAVNLTIGTIYGAIAGYYGGTVDIIMERITDILSGIPFMVVTVLFQLHLSGKVGAIPSLIYAFVLTGWIGMSSRVRMQFYRFKNQEYVLAARTLGANDWSIMFKHIFPNSLGTIITGSILVIPGVIFSETSLTYLGIINLDSPTMSSIGSMLANGQSVMSSYPHIMLYPALFIALLEISFNLFGNGLRDAFNPSLRGTED